MGEIKWEFRALGEQRGKLVHWKVTRIDEGDLREDSMEDMESKLAIFFFSKARILVVCLDYIWMSFYLSRFCGDTKTTKLWLGQKITL